MPIKPPPKALIDNMRNNLRTGGIIVSGPQLSTAMLSVAMSLPKTDKLYKTALNGSWELWDLDKDIIEEARIARHGSYPKCRKDFLLLSKYITGSDLNLKGLPLGNYLKKQKFAENCLKATIRKNNYTLYRKYTFRTKAQYNKWFGDEVVHKKSYKDGDSIVLNIKAPSSWTESKDIVVDHLFSGGGNLNVIVCLKTNKNAVFADLTFINAAQQEVVLKQGKYTCKIISINTDTDVIIPPPTDAVDSMREEILKKGLNASSAQISKAMISVFNKIKGNWRYDEMYYSALDGRWDWTGAYEVYAELMGNFNPEMPGPDDD